VVGSEGTKQAAQNRFYKRETGEASITSPMLAFSGGLCWLRRKASAISLAIGGGGARVGSDLPHDNVRGDQSQTRWPCCSETIRRGVSAKCQRPTKVSSALVLHQRTRLAAVHSKSPTAPPRVISQCHGWLGGWGGKATAAAG
jgi:hypothetical protein